ncbi:MAG: amphi-Trp domain-containing protein [Candidatus Eisenbacteria bacterium]|nr:amphi-Trp domain-containing protein [Candidatus Eisenbacteria bacterium]
MSDDKRFEYESIHDPQTITAYLQSVLEGIVQRRIVLTSDGDEIVLRPGNLLKLAVKAKRKDDTSRLSIKISWKDSPNSESAEE